MQEDSELEESPDDESESLFTDNMLREALTASDVHQCAAEEPEMGRNTLPRHPVARQQSVDSDCSNACEPLQRQAPARRGRMLSKEAVKAAMATAERRAEKAPRQISSEASIAEAFAAISQVANLAKVGIPSSSKFVPERRLLLPSSLRRIYAGTHEVI